MAPYLLHRIHAFRHRDVRMPASTGALLPLYGNFELESPKHQPVAHALKHAR